MTWWHLFAFCSGILLGRAWAQDNAMIALRDKTAWVIYGHKLRVSKWIPKLND